MNKFDLIFSNNIIQVSILAWFVAQAIKVITVLIFDKKMDFRKFISSGGMPSSHSSFVCSMTTMVGEKVGYDSSMFAVCVIISLVIMYDASGVRRSVGKQAIVLNDLIEEFSKEGIVKEGRLKELLGHTPIEVFAGAFLGIIIALLSVN